jgi:predicted alpha/beta-fold hydrolase
MTESYRPAWWLPDPHSMTLWPRFFRARPALPTRTETWEAPDGDEIDVVRLDAPAGAPRVLLLHGLEGSARSHYAAGVFLECLRRGWAADLLLFRTCNGRMNRARRSYHSGETTDLDFVVRAVAREHPDAPIGLVGVSLGANVLLKWLGERAEAVASGVVAAIAVSTPFDLARSSRRIDRGFSRLYQWHFLRSLREKGQRKIALYPDLASRDAVARARTLWEFDDAFTAAVHGFRDAADYAARSSSIDFLGAIRLPTLLLSARDDPFHPPDVLADVEAIAAGNPYLVVEFPQRGGHAGFIEGEAPWRARFYTDRRIGDYLTAHFGRLRVPVPEPA